MRVGLYVAGKGRPCFLNNLSRILIIAERDKLGMPKSISLRPLKDLDLRDDRGAYPDAFLHVLCV
jgi:hypothetical protein